MVSGTEKHKRSFQILVVCLLAFTISAGVRLLEVGRWDPGLHQLDGEYLLSTHDAYAWVSGAVREDARTAGYPMSRSLSLPASYSSVSVANLAFWLAPILAAMSAIPIVLWASRLGASPVAALAAGALGSLAPAFYTRTRVGYYDTDWATLFFPLIISFSLALWLEPHIMGSSMARSHAGEGPWDLKRSASLMLLVLIALPWHGFIQVHLLAMLWIGLALLIIKRGGEVRLTVGFELFALILTVGLGWIGAAAGLALLLLSQRLSIERYQPGLPRWLIALILIGLLFGFTVIQFQDYLSARIAHYFNITDTGASSLVYPDLSASVRETQEIDIKAALSGIAFQWWLGVVGVIGFAYTVYRKPVALLFVPSLLLGLLSPLVGVRFTMFGSPVVFLGLLVPLSSFFPDRLSVRGQGQVNSDILFLAVLIVSLVLITRNVQRLPVETVLTPEHAAALRELDTVSEQDGLIWTWWDYGYASQYFAGMPTFADGGRNTGPYLFTLARVLWLDDIAASAALMNYAAGYDHKPWIVWETWEPQRLDEWLENPEPIASSPASETPQFLAVQWEALSFLPWIQYYGSWDFSSREGQTSAVRRPEPLRLDLQAGDFTERGGQVFSLISADVFDAAGIAHYDYTQRGQGLHLLVDLEKSDLFLLDDRSYRSTMVQLLVRPASSFDGSEPFELLVDRSPETRLFRLR